MAEPDKKRSQKMGGGENDKKSVKKENKSRGTEDDFEILKMIVAENRGLFLRVLDKIRTIRTVSKENIFDVASKKQQQKFTNTRAKREDVG